VRLLAEEEIKRVVSSPHVRCVQTVEPLAADRGFDVEYHDALAEGAPLRATLALMEEASVEAPVLCTHGDVVGNVIGHLESLGVPGADETKCKKGSTWVLTVENAEFVRAEYLPPPA
jgi:8-oxo-dGTP diphosphatase